MKISSLFTVFVAVSAGPAKGGFKGKMSKAIKSCESECDQGPELKIYRDR